MPLTRITTAKDNTGNLFVFGGSDARLSNPPGDLTVGFTGQLSSPEVWSSWVRVDTGTEYFTVGPPTPFADLFGVVNGLPSVFVLDGGRVFGIETLSGPSGPYYGPRLGYGGDALIQASVGRNTDGRLECFAIDWNQQGLWHMWQQWPNGFWSDWQSLSGTQLQQVSVRSNADGRLEVFVLGGDRGVWHIWQQSPNGAWSGWQSLGGTELLQVVVGSNADARLEVFALGGDRGLWHIWQTTPNGNWGGWQPLGGIDLQQFAVGDNADGRLEVIAVGGDQRLWHTRQLVRNGNWGGWELLLTDPIP